MAVKEASAVRPSARERLLAAAKALRASGTPAYSIGGSEGWTLTDLFENIYAHTAGPEKYRQLSKHEIPWTDQSVKDALTEMGKVLAADVFSTDPPLGKPSKYTVLADPKHIGGFQNVAPIVSKDIDSADLRKVANAVSKKLTVPAMQAMNKAVAIDKQSPAKVAAQFLKANGLK